MDSLDALPLPALAALIFCLRIVDVSLGTCRTIAVVQGRSKLAVALGFIEVLVWVTTVAHVIGRASDNVWLLLAYAGGFAAGNAVGIVLERRLALGSVILRIVSHGDGDGHRVAEALREDCPRVFAFDGVEDEESVTLVYVAARRRRAQRLLKKAQQIDPDLFYAVDPLGDSNWMLSPTPAVPSSWQSRAKKK